MARNKKLWLYIPLVLLPCAYFFWFFYVRPGSRTAEQAAQPPDQVQSEIAKPVPEPSYMPVGEAVIATSSEYLVGGRIISELDEALPEATVSLHGSAPRWAAPAFEQPAPLDTQTCDAEGRYQFRLNAPANLWISIRKDGYAAINAFLPVRDTKATVRDFQLRPALATLVGFVFDKQDTPISGALVIVNTPPFTPIADNAILAPTGRLTDANGKYTMEGLPDGDVSIIASCRGYLLGEELGTLKTGQSQQVDFHLPPATPISFVVNNSRGEVLPYATATAPGQFKISGGDKRGVIEISIPLEWSPFDCTVAADGYKTRTVLFDPKAPPGAVTLEDRPVLKGRVTAERGGPVVDALVSVWGTGGVQGKFDSTAPTDKAGRFSLPLLYPPVREIKVTRLGYFDQRLTFDNTNPAPPEVAVRLKRVEAGIYGRVIDYRGIPIKRFIAHLRNPGAKPPIQDYQRSFSDDRGGFTITDAAPGSYTLIIQSVQSSTADDVQIITRENVEIRKGFLLGEILMQFPPPRFKK
jgi:hypothetical protein